MAPESFDPERAVRVLHYGRARHVYRVLFWIDGAKRIVNVLHSPRRTSTRSPIQRGTVVEMS